MMTDDELAKARQGISLDLDADGKPIDVQMSLLAEIALQVGRIATNTDRPTLRVNGEQIRKAWDSTGMRMYEDRFVEGLRALGVQITDEEPKR